MSIIESVVGGLARTFDLFGTHHQPTKPKSVKEAIAEDWQAVADDTRKVFEREIPERLAE